MHLTPLEKLETFYWNSTDQRLAVFLIVKIINESNFFPNLRVGTAQKIKFSIKDFFSKCDQIRSFLRIWSHLLKKSLMKSFIFLYSVAYKIGGNTNSNIVFRICWILFAIADWCWMSFLLRLPLSHVQWWNAFTYLQE